MRFVQYFSKRQTLNRGINEQRTDPRTVVQTASLLLVASFPIQSIPRATFPSSERTYDNSVLLVNILNQLHFHGTPSTASMDVLTPPEESLKLTNWFTKETIFLLLSCISVSCISDSQDVRRKERIFSKAGESECPAVQLRPWGEALMLQ